MWGVALSVYPHGPRSILDPRPMKTSSASYHALRALSYRWTCSTTAMHMPWPYYEATAVHTV